MQRFIEGIKVGNECKSFGEYKLANEIFANLLEDYFELPLSEKEETESGPPAAWLEWETQDVVGEYPGEVYYDLLVICAAEPTDEEGWRLLRLNIPVPLLGTDAAMTALKAAAIVERGQHGREHVAPVEDQIERLTDMVGELCHQIPHWYLVRDNDEGEPSDSASDPASAEAVKA